MSSKEELDKAFIDMMLNGIGFTERTINKESGEIEIKRVNPKDVYLSSEEIEKLKREQLK